MNIFGFTGAGPYVDMPLEERAIRIDSAGINPPLPKILPDTVYKRIPKESVAKLAAIHEEFGELQKALHQLTVDQVANWKGVFSRAAAEAENPALSHASSSEIKDRMRQTRREMSRQFKDAHYANYWTALGNCLAAVVPQVEKLIVEEDNAERKKLESYGLPQLGPSALVSSLIAYRTFVKRQLETAQARVSGSPQDCSSLEIDCDLMRLCGIDIKKA